MTRATLQEGDEQSPTWLPDGRRFVLSSNTSGQPNLFRQSVDGTSSPEPLLTGPYAQMPLTVTPDGRTLVYFQSSGAGAELWSLPLEGPDSTPRALLTGGRTWGADLSPDRRWLAYHSNESGRDEVYVRPFPNVQVGASRRDRRRAAPWRPHHLVEARLLRRIHGAEPRPSRIRRGAGRLALPHDQGCGRRRRCRRQPLMSSSAGATGCVSWPSLPPLSRTGPALSRRGPAREPPPT